MSFLTTVCISSWSPTVVNWNSVHYCKSSNTIATNNNAIIIIIIMTSSSSSNIVSSNNSIVESIKDQLNKQANSTCQTQMSVGDLLKNKKYLIMKFDVVVNKFGPVVVCTLVCTHCQDGQFKVCLPRSVMLSEEEITRYNTLPVKNIHLVFKGMRGRSFDITFTETE